MNRQEIKNEYNGYFVELRKIINSWNLLPNSSNKAFDSLNNKILDYLYKNADKDKIEKVLESELIISYGLFRQEIKVEKYSCEIMNWWNSK